jgi:hypothetical protein
MPGVVMHTYNPSYTGAEMEGLRFESNHCKKKKLTKSYLKNKPGGVTRICNTSHVGDRGRRL